MLIRAVLVGLAIVVLFAMMGCASLNSETAPERIMTEKNALQTYVYFIEPSRDGFVDSPTREEEERVGEHFEYLKGLTEEGVVLLAGPSTDPPYTGIVIFKAGSEDQARSIMAGDPAVRAGVFKARLSPFVMSLVGKFH